MTIADFKKEMNELGQGKVPFLFIVDFELQQPRLIRLAEINPAMMLYDINGFTNATPQEMVCNNVLLEKTPEPFSSYANKFNTVAERLSYGDSFLTNLTIKTEVKLNCSLRQIFHLCYAKYKLFVAEQFLVFSPEIFVQINDGIISSFPMKGTIDAALPNARDRILNDLKELSEHVTIVDLIRNDLSQVATDVRVEKFRYIDKIKTEQNELLQVSSMITGRLGQDYTSSLGDIMVTLLPAGSVTGAPKAKTLDIIKFVEKEKRGYYTGVFGVFDGNRLDSGVMIRFLEQDQHRYFYRSGGGITTQSIANNEYDEAIDKVYVPLA